MVSNCTILLLYTDQPKCLDDRWDTFWSRYLGLRVEHAHLQLIVMAMSFGLTQVYEAGLDAEDHVVEGFRTGDQVERSRKSTTLIKIGKPKFCSGKFPLHIGILLQRQPHGDRRCVKMMSGDGEKTRAKWASGNWKVIHYLLGSVSELQIVGSSQKRSTYTSDLSTL